MDANVVSSSKIVKTTSTENKENVSITTATTYSVATLISKSSLENKGVSAHNPYGTILSSLNHNNTNTSLNMNDSIDFKSDAYEKQINKLTNENKSLRKRVKNLTELARDKEEQLLSAFSEDKRKNQENIQIEHASQLQSYYECFLQIGKENDLLKSRVDQMKNKISEQQKLIDELNSKLETQVSLEHDTKLINDISSPDHDNDRDHEHESVKNEELNKDSMKHIDEELTNLNKSIKLFIEDSKQRKMSIAQPIESASSSMDLNDLLLKQQRIDELELDKETLNKKLTSIESSLQRWIFRACDYKSDLTKSNEKLVDLESRFAELHADWLQLKDANDSKLVELQATLALNVSQLEEMKKELTAKCDEASVLKESLREKSESLAQWESRALAKAKLIDAHTQTGLLMTNKSSGLVAQTAAKLSQLISNDDFRPTVQPATGSIESIKLESITNELNQLKSKLDSVTMERNLFKSKTEEMSRQIEKFNSNNNKVSTKVVEAKAKMNETKSTQTHTSKPPPPPIPPPVESHTNNIINSNNNNNNNNLASEVEQLKTKIETLKKEMDFVKLKSNKDHQDWTNKLDERVEEINKLEQLLKNEKTLTLTLNKKITDLNEKVVKMAEDMEEVKRSYEARIAQSNQDNKIEKEISGTIIQQQKKLLDFMQIKLGGGAFSGFVAESTNSGGNHQPNSEPSTGHNLISLLNKKFKSSNNNNNNANPLLANLQKTTNQQYLSKSSQNNKVVQPPKQKLSEIEAELNSNYVTYSELNKKNQKTNEIEFKVQVEITHSDNKNAIQSSKTKPATTVAPLSQKKQIHVFITGLNTCPTYCHVCQQLIQLIAFASKCQLCSFTCHSTCSSSSQSSHSSKSKSFKQTNQANLYDPLKYCHINYLTNGIEYNSYINRVINYTSNKQTFGNGGEKKGNNFLLGDYLYINVDNKWKRLWLSLRLDQPQLDLYQTKSNHKPFDTINLLNDRVQIETNIKQIKKLLSTSEKSSSSSREQSVINLNPHQSDEDNIYEELNENTAYNQSINFEQSSLIILLHSTKLCLQIGFTSFNKKNIWYDALQSSILLAQSTGQLQTKRSHTTLNPNQPDQTNQFKCFDINKVLKPFLELCDTIVNSYCFINENLIALACDDGLYALNSFVNSNNRNNQQENMSSNISLVKIDSIESAHKLYYQVEFGKLCFIGRKTRQFLSIDIQELNESLINGDFNYTNKSMDGGTSGSECELDDDEAKSIRVKLETINDIDRCHLFECAVNQNGVWYLAVATPESIFVLFFNKISNKYTMVQSIPTNADSPCLCIKFRMNDCINQLIYGSGKEFYKMDLAYLQSSLMIDSQMKKNINEELSIQHANHQNQQPIAVGVIRNASNEKQEAVLLCYEEYGVFLIYNSTAMAWQQPFNNGSGASGANSSKKSSFTSLASNNNYIRWPRGNSLTPLQIEFDISYLYLFYNDSIVVYNILFENESLLVKKLGITFVYKPRYLSTFHTANTNCLIISNRRPLESGADTSATSNNYSDNQSEYNEYEEFDGGIKSSRLNNPVMQDLNNKICLSYFSPDSD